MEKTHRDSSSTKPALIRLGLHHPASSHKENQNHHNQLEDEAQGLLVNLGNGLEDGNEHAHHHTQHQHGAAQLDGDPDALPQDLGN